MEDDTPYFASSSSLRARDEVFCHETARRAVARAALHLGIESMSVEAADTMAGILIAYLERIGQVIATNVEASGRSSAHVNFLDALRAVEVCTEPAVAAVFQDSSAASQAGEVSQNDKERYNHTEQMSWKGLAAFCFGKQWREAKTTVTVTAAPRGRGGKGVGEEVDANDGDEMDKDNEVSTYQGWNAPYPEEVIPFPVAGPGVANPHALPEDLLVAEQVPDQLFNENGEKKRKRDDENDSKPPAKITRTEDNGDAKDQDDKKDKMDIDTLLGGGQPAAAEDDKYRPWYFPKHWPSFPRREVGTQALVVDNDALDGVGDDEIDDILRDLEGKPPSAKSTSHQTDPTRSVRTALVQMGWGTMREVAGGKDNYDLRVVAGAKLDAVPSTAPAQIVPLAKASVARVNRILEGSMD